nr:MAG TPA: hypothetical protein [Crassvirales sp.]
MQINIKRLILEAMKIGYFENFYTSTFISE